MAVKKGPFARGASRARARGFERDSIARDRRRPTRAPRRASAERVHRLTHRARHARAPARRRDHLEDARVREDVADAPTQRPGARRRRATLASIPRAPPARDARRLTTRASFVGFAEKRQTDPGRGEGSEEGGRARPPRRAPPKSPPRRRRRDRPPSPSRPRRSSLAIRARVFRAHVPHARPSRAIARVPRAARRRARAIPQNAHPRLARRRRRARRPRDNVPEWSKGVDLGRTRDRRAKHSTANARGFKSRHCHTPSPF